MKNSSKRASALNAASASYATNYYRSKVAAHRYHELFGFSRMQTTQMLTNGLIHVGQPSLAVGETLIELDGGRYAIRPSVDAWIDFAVGKAA